MALALFHNLPPGGAKRALFEHARGLHARGCAIDAYLPATADEEFLSIRPFCRDVFVYDCPAPPAAPHPLTARRADRGYARRVWNGCVAMRGQIRHLRALEKVYAAMAADIDARGYDLAYVHHCRFLPAPFLLRRLQTPSVYFCQDTLRHVHEWAVDTDAGYDAARSSWTRRKVRGRVVSPFILRVMREQERRDTENVRAATRVLANSLYSREAILRAYGVDAQVCYLGVDSDFFRPDPSARRENVVLSVGNLVPAKRHDFILEAVATIPEARRPRMHVVGYDALGTARFGGNGRGPMGEALLRLADARGVCLRILPEVSDETLREAYRRAAVVAFAPYLEPFGFIPLEAMACATPVVGVSEGGVRETIRDNETGFLTGRDPVAFGRALERILADEALAARLGSAGRESVVERWTWDSSVDTLERCFEAAAGSGGPE